MSNAQLNYDEIRKRAEIRVKKRTEFIKHLAIYIIVNLFIWAFFGFIALFVSHTFYVLIPAVLSTLGWGLGVAIHGVTTYLDTSRLETMRDREIEREMQRELAMRGMSEVDLYEKPKRDRVARLSDDGEIVYDEEPPAEARKTRRDQR
ncbi:MAG: 2TM domain-containing protein [Anaerolineae bacterium]|nr:2TM domain-containing protein [Anaerolineae bacterium]